MVNAATAEQSVVTGHEAVLIRQTATLRLEGSGCIALKMSREVMPHHPDSCPRQSGEQHGGTVDLSDTEGGSIRKMKMHHC